MRKFLDRLYLAGGMLGAFFLFMTAALILLAVAGSLFRFVTRSLDEFAGYCMAASAFLALAYTLRTGEHIRMALFLQAFHGRTRQALELFATIVGVIFAGFMAFYSVKLCLVSYQLNDLSQGIVPLPLWIPQSAMAVGCSLFLIAMIDRLVCLLMGLPVPEDHSDARADR